MSILPGFDDFVELATQHRVIPVWRTLLADQVTPVAIFARCAGEGDGFLLESVENGERWSRWSFLGRNPLATIRSVGGNIEVSGPLSDLIPIADGMLSTLELLLDRFSAPAIAGLPPLHSGVMGYLGYDVVREVECLPNTPEDDTGFDDAVMAVIGELAAFDHWKQQVTLIANTVIPDGSDRAALREIYDEAADRLIRLQDDGARPLDEPLVQPPPLDAELPDVTSTMGADMYEHAVGVAKEYILAGDIFQVVLAQRFDFDLDADPFDVYRVLRQVNPSPYMYFLRIGELSIVGASPEPLVQLLDGRVISRPIAGTRPRGSSDEEDRILGAELREHPKEVAEHIMLVDLARNDIGRVITFGTESRDQIMALERYSHVMHLTSQVSGSLAAGKSAIDVLRATLPAGTVSGAPKVRAMEIIDELEPVKRGPYAGVVGYIDFSGSIDTAIAIRTMFVRGNLASVQAGAGIVADSVPADEQQECVHKSKALLAAVPGARLMTEQRREAAQRLAGQRGEAS